jgi:hypothetical protein
MKRRHLLLTMILSALACCGSAQLCWDENPSLVPPKKDPQQVCAPRARGGFGFWTRATSLVGADSYVMPKYASRGYTFTAQFGVQNDFNSPPRLLHYVNYIHPVPYTHPPVYPSVPGGGNAAPGISQGLQKQGTVFIEY